MTERPARATMRLPCIGLALAVVGLTSLAGCGSRDRSSALDHLNSATLEAGVGLADLQLGVTTLADFTNRIGTGRSSAVIGDESAVELTFAAQRMSFLFTFGPDCARELGSAVRTVGNLIEEPTQFFADFPDCADTPLTSLSIGADPGGDAPFYLGSSDRGARLLMPATELMQLHDEPADIPGLTLAGTTPDDGRYEYLNYADGLAVHIGAAEAGESAGKQVIVRLSVFLPPSD